MMGMLATALSEQRDQRTQQRMEMYRGFLA
jgi:hypothetical protein